MKRALVTRPREDSEGIARALAGRGYEVQVEPLLEIVPRSGVALVLTGVQGILATSANGVRALAVNLAGRDLPVWAVGDATARTARELGFHHVETARGDVGSLVALVATRCDRSQGALLHAAGSAVAGDLAGQLSGAGFEVRREVLYEARTATALSPALCQALDQNELEVALFFSPRTAATFATLTRAAGRETGCAGLAAYALSPAVARELAALPWRSVITAARPEQESMLAAIDAANGKP
ncbi:MAG TPA: uroporphyrinogen-III synthase [Patescibacteria group bacterium]|nr:uroporphyrinogen-III synthase [Patescibacteria group bacterium]